MSKEKYTIDQVFCKNSSASRKVMRDYVKRHKLLEYQCQKCGCNGIWQNEPISLEIDHIDGDETNNELSNLRYLCPNCHSLTDTWRGKNKTKKLLAVISDEQFIEALKESQSISQALRRLDLNPQGANYSRARKLIEDNNIILEKDYLISKEKIKYYCPICGAEKKSKNGLCIKCSYNKQRVVERPNRELFKKEIRNIPFRQLGKKYDVSDKTISKWCKAYGLPYRKQDINAYSNEEWNKL